jgi:eukaryotic-like serine/threonine-protein kinase
MPGERRGSDNETVDPDDSFLRDVAHAPEIAPASDEEPDPARLGPFRVIGRLGRGGMGIVYRAEDEKLRRPVALKVLPIGVSGDADRRRRFLREARSAAAITHPNIATIYEVGEADGRVFLAMELVEGETLRARLVSGALPLPESLRIGRAIALGLEKAHEKGVIHRDVKPDNVMIDRDGAVKILDFGLAKLREEQSPAALPYQPTESHGTEEGRVHGTPAYMSPEQAAGKAVDARSDLFSLGVTLYEMATGLRPFAAATTAETIAAILRDEPIPPSRSQVRVPPDLERVILRALRKKPEDRFASAAAMRMALEQCSSMETPSNPRVARLALGAAFVALVVAGLGVVRSRRPAALPALAPAASASVAPAPTIVRIIDQPPPNTTVPAAAAEYTAALQAMHDDSWLKSLGLFAKAVALDPKMAAAHLHLSIAMLVVNNPPARRAEFEVAAGLRAQLSDRDTGLLEAMAPVLQNATQDPAEADRRLRALAERYPGDVELWMLLEIVHYATAAALDPAERALKLDPGDAQSWESEGLAYYAQGKYKEARAAFERCGTLSVDGADCFAWLGLVDSAEGHCADFEKHEHSAADRNPVWSLGILWAMASTGQRSEIMEETASQIAAALPAEFTPAVIDAGMKVRLAILEGDFARAKLLATRESALIVGDPALRASYGRRYLVAGHLFDIALETGDDASMRSIANDFVTHRDAWSSESMMGHGADLSLYFARLALPDGPPGASFEALRQTWVDRALFAGADPGQVWVYAYASTSMTPDDARSALDALAHFGPAAPSSGFPWELTDRAGSPEADIGRVYLLAGRVDDAIEHLTRAAAQCDQLTSTIDHVRAELNLGLALEQKPDRVGACAAYGKVLARWGHAKPRSVTADAARARATALRCGG